MKKKKQIVRQKSTPVPAKSWLPVDQSLIPDVFSFGHVTGLAKVFLQIEILLSILVVIGSLSLLVLQFFK